MRTRNRDLHESSRLVIGGTRWRNSYAVWYTGSVSYWGVLESGLDRVRLCFETFAGMWRIERVVPGNHMGLYKAGKGKTRFGRLVELDCTEEDGNLDI